MTDASNLRDQRFLIIAGASKAGTTSVFSYLSEHREICASGSKETRFFLGADYPLPSEIRSGKDELATYYSLFDVEKIRNKGAWGLEATPDYLYSPGTARLIRETLPNARLIFILREPVSRLRSFYGFGKQLNEIPRSMTFDEYIELQKGKCDRDLLKRYQHPVFAALSHGRYSIYLKPFLEQFGRSAIHIIFYEQLRLDPRACMSSICCWAGIDESYFQGYAFEVKNKGLSVRSQRLHRTYFDTKRNARRWVRHRPRLRAMLREAGRQVNMVYRRMNLTQREEISMSRLTEEFISSYYMEERASLKEMFGVVAPWPQDNGPKTSELFGEGQ